MTDATVFRLEREIRERSSLRATCDPPNFELCRALIAAVERERLNIRPDEALRLVTLAERLTGVKP